MKNSVPSSSYGPAPFIWFAMTSILRHKIWIPITAFAVLAAVAFLLWRQQNIHDRELVLRYIETSIEQVRIRVEGLMQARLASLELMADRWVERDPPDFSWHRFQGFAAALHKNYPGYSTIFWIDPSGVIRWVFPEDVDAAAIDVGSVTRHLSPGNGTTGENGGIEIDLVMTPCAPLQQDPAGFSAVRALMMKNDFQGYLGGFFSVGKIMMLSLTKEVLDDFNISVSEQARIIFQHGSPGKSHKEMRIQEPSADPQAFREVRFGPKTWTLHLSLNQAARSNALDLNAGFLAFGLTLAAALSLLLHLLLQRIDMYKRSRDQAIVEVSERKNAQTLLRENEQKLQALLEELTSKNAELESFVYTVSHDLKTPIVTIEGFIGALREDFSASISEVSDQYLSHMSNAARKMEQLISELLNYSRIGRLESPQTTFPMSLAINDAIATLRTQIESRGVIVNVQQDLPAVHGDRKRVEQVVYNLLSNAIKYIGRDNPEPRIDIGCTEQNGQNVFWVRDNGIGIDKRYYDKIFQIFERLPAAKQAGEGTGIGLAIVKRIVEHHGGTVWLSSELGKGTTFYLTFNEKGSE
jgi:signal transduction histidine kinase